MEQFGMVFVAPSILILGGLCLAIPIALHLLMKQRPKRIEFPALRFVKLKQAQNQRRLKLRHFLLLLLRCALIALLAATLARPSVAAEELGNWLLLAGMFLLTLIAGFITLTAYLQSLSRIIFWSLTTFTLLLLFSSLIYGINLLTRDEATQLASYEAPVAAILLFDTTPPMQYRFQNKLRIEQAQADALWLTKQFPSGSQIAIIDHAQGGNRFSVNLGAAQKAIENLKINPSKISVHRLLQKAFGLLKTKPELRQEIYLFTDLNRQSFEPEIISETLRNDYEKKLKNISLYIIDVGVKNPKNFLLGDLKLSTENLSRNTTLTINTEVKAIGTAGKCRIDLKIEKPNPSLPRTINGVVTFPEEVPRGSQQVTLEKDQVTKVSFTGIQLPPGTHHGSVNIVGQDNLILDNRRFFTVTVQPSYKILVCAKQKEDANIFIQTLEPAPLKRSGQSPFSCDFQSLLNLDQQQQKKPASLDGFAKLPLFSPEQLRKYDVVCLLDPPPFSAAIWQKLTQHLHHGGKFFLALGPNAAPAEKFNNAAAQEILPGKLDLPWRAGAKQHFFLVPQRSSHSLLRNLTQPGQQLPWHYFPVHKHWTFQEKMGIPSADGDASANKVVRTIIRFNNNEPALLEHRLGLGHVLTMTTPWPDKLEPTARVPWNVLPLGTRRYPFFRLSRKMMFYLLQNNEKLNYQTGQTVITKKHHQDEPDPFLLYTPQAEKHPLIYQEGELAIRATEAPGTYYLKGSNRKRKIARGFSVNLPKHATDLTRIETETLKEIFGKAKYHLAQKKDQIKRKVGTARRGQAFFPYLLLLVAVFLGLEHLLANYFYRN